jgi:hypothetical protein
VAEFRDPPTWLTELARALYGPNALRQSPDRRLLTVGTVNADSLHALRMQVERPPEPPPEE